MLVCERQSDWCGARPDVLGVCRTLCAGALCRAVGENTALRDSLRRLDELYTSETGNYGSVQLA